jgi:hypothetical protein
MVMEECRSSWGDNLHVGAGAGAHAGAGGEGEGEGGRAVAEVVQPDRGQPSLGG